MKDAQKAKQKYGAKIAVGGPGSWQLLRPEANGLFDVDCVFIGEGGSLVAYRPVDFPKWQRA